MSETPRKRILDLRRRINLTFCLIFKKDLIRQNDQIGSLDEECRNYDDFAVKIGTLSLLIDDFDMAVLRSCLKGNYPKLKSISLLEKLLIEKNLNSEDVIRGLRIIRRIRSKSPPFHGVPAKEAVKALEAANIKPPFDWNSAWTNCLNIYADSLEKLSEQLASYTSKVEYRKQTENEVLKAFEQGRIIYLNDALYKYRLLVPVNYKYKMELLVDYLTAAVIAYDRKLKSINYALRKYVTPFKKKFTEHTEDIYFVKKRPYLRHSFLLDYHIILQWDKTQLRDEKEYARYFRYVYAGVVAYQMGLTPDWLIKEYWGSSWLSEGYKPKT